MQGLRCHFISLSGKSPTKLEVTSRHDHSCLLGRKASNQTNKTISQSTEKPVLSGHSKMDNTKVLKTDGSLMQVESTPEFSNEHSAVLLTCIK